MDEDLGWVPPGGSPPTPTPPRQPASPPGVAPRAPHPTEVQRPQHPSAPAGRPWVLALSIAGVLVILLPIVTAALLLDRDEGAERPVRGPGVPSTETRPTEPERLEPVAGATEARRGGTLRVGLEVLPQSWDPTSTVWRAPALAAAMAVYDPLAARSFDGRVVPFLASSIDSDPSFRTWTIGLRDDVLLHDGTRLDADVVARNLTARLDQRRAAPALSPVETVEVVDDLTVEVKCSQPWATFPDILTGQIGLVTGTTGRGPRTPNGTGPFRQVRNSQGPSSDEKEVLLERNEDYWRPGLPYLDELSLHADQDADTRLERLTSGELDAALFDHGLSYEAVEQHGLSLTGDGGQPPHLTIAFNTTRSPFDDLRMRRALAMSTDRAAAAEAAGVDWARTAAAWPWGLDGTRSPPPPSETPTATELVAEYESERGAEVAITVAVPDIDEYVQAAFSLRDGWQAIGVDVRVMVEAPISFPSTLYSDDPHVLLWPMFGGAEPDMAASALTEPGALNYAELIDPEMVEAMDAAMATDDTYERTEQFSIVRERLHALVPYVVLWEQRGTVASRAEVRDVGAHHLPDGQRAEAFTEGAPRFAETWLET